MKILSGGLLETLYDWPAVDAGQQQTSALKVTAQHNYARDQVTYMSGEGWHSCPWSACDVSVRSACGVSVRSACDVSVRSACGMSVRSACGVSVKSACGVSVRSACDVSVRSACDVSVRSACDSQ